MKNVTTFVLATLIALIHATTLAQDTSLLQIRTPNVGDVCTYQATDLLYPQTGAPNLIQMTVTDVSSDGVVTYARKILKGDTPNSEEGKPATTNKSNRHGWVKRGRTFDPYQPVLGVNAGVNLVVTPGSDLGEVTYTRKAVDGDGSTNATVEGRVSQWENVTVPAGSFKTLRLIWSGYSFREQAAFKHSKKNNPFSYSVSLSPETSCEIVKIDTLGGVARTRTELISYSTATSRDH